jgi:hypothetical protein
VSYLGIARKRQAQKCRPPTQSVRGPSLIRRGFVLAERSTSGTTCDPPKGNCPPRCSRAGKTATGERWAGTHLTAVRRIGLVRQETRRFSSSPSDNSERMWWERAGQCAPCPVNACLHSARLGTAPGRSAVVTASSGPDSSVTSAIGFVGTKPSRWVVVVIGWSLKLTTCNWSVEPVGSRLAVTSMRAEVPVSSQRTTCADASAGDCRHPLAWLFAVDDNSGETRCSIHPNPPCQPTATSCSASSPCSSAS